MMTSNSALLRKAAVHMPFAAALLGMVIVFGGIALFYFENPVPRITTIAVGIFVIISGIWFAANPFLKNERRYLGLRAEVNQFIQLTRTLNRTAVEKRGQEDFEQAKAAMHESVERMALLAGAEGVVADRPSPGLSVTTGSGTKQAATRAS